MASHSTLLTAVGHRVVAGIDLGATHSGFAYAHVSDPSKIEGFYEWDDQLVPYCKNLTALLWDVSKQEPVAWGYSTLKEASGNPAAKVLDKIKLFVEPSAADCLDAFIPAGVDPLTIVAQYLKALHKIFLTKLQEKFGPDLQNEDVHYALTVPSIWSDQAKNNLRQAAVLAGLIAPAEISLPRLSLVLEPEAAAIYCCKKVREAQLKNGDTLLTVDAGGATVETVLQKITSSNGILKLVELSRSTGDLCGSTFVDKLFLEWLGRKVGDDALAQLKAERDNDYHQLLVNWESLKRQFKGAETFRNKEQITFPLPTALYNLMSDEYMEALEEQQGGIADEVFLKFEDMQAFFDPVVNKGLGLIEEQLAKCPNGQCNKLFVVGGFSGSPYLGNAIRERFTDTFEHIIFPLDPGAAVVQGAVLYGLDPHSIQARCARYTYGIKLHQPEAHFVYSSPRRPNPSDIIPHEETRVPYVTYFHPVMVANQLVQVDDYYVTKCMPMTKTQTMVEVEISATPYEIKKNTSFSDVTGGFHLGKLLMSGLPASGDRSVTVYFYFGLTDLRCQDQWYWGGKKRDPQLCYSLKI